MLQAEVIYKVQLLAKTLVAATVIVPTSFWVTFFRSKEGFG